MDPLSALREELAAMSAACTRDRLDFLYGYGFVKSPIEALFLWGLICASWGRELSVLVVPPEDSFCGREVWPHAGELSENPPLRIECQPLIAKLLPDFRITFVDCGLVASVLVECDGHDFHDRTKEQVSRDKKRDRRLMREGSGLLRFAGSELHRHAKACAHEVLDFLILGIERQIPARGR